MTDLRWRDAILRVMQDAGEPMHYAEIAQEIIDQGYRDRVGATPAATVAATLSQQLAGKVSRVRVGVYELTEAHTSADGAPVPVTASDALVQQRGSDASIAQEEMGLINAFGMFWRRGEVDWSVRTPRLLGEQQAGSDPVDFAEQSGVYLLYDGHQVIYVGRITSPRLGSRLWEHTRDRLKGRWDHFSWFGVRPTGADGRLGELPAAGIAVETLIATLEALLIEGLEPPQNRRQGDGFSALEFIQVLDPEIERRQKQALLAQAMASIGSQR